MEYPFYDNVHGHQNVRDTVKRTCLISLSSLWLSCKTKEMLKMCVYASTHTYIHIRPEYKKYLGKLLYCYFCLSDGKYSCYEKIMFQ